MTTLRALQCLVAPVDTGSVTKAAAVLHLAQPALSHQIAGLERELSTPVVERRARGVRVTAAGLAAAKEARVALRAAARAVEAGRQTGEGRVGRLRLACVETMTVWLLVPILGRWIRERPDVQFVERHQVALRPVIRTRSPRTAVQLAGAGTGVTVAPVSALTARPMWCGAWNRPYSAAS
ncbi:LysR family transcriptional regulator [Streptomyces sp. FB2]|uniref:LysR family transcriptional regulator n=1 Tax=Streptomyces sp. FB2 TaxID=2902454 RepID=UPI00225E241E